MSSIEPGKFSEGLTSPKIDGEKPLESVRDKIPPSTQTWGEWAWGLVISSPPEPDQAVDTLITALKSKKGEHAEGIFRLSGNQEKVKTIHTKLRSDKFYKLPADLGINETAGILKRYFGQRLELFSEGDLKKMFLQAGVDGNVTLLRTAVESLPPSKKEALKNLVLYLKEIEKNQAETMMNAQNLSIVWGPCLLSTKKEPKDMAEAIRETAQASTSTKLLIDRAFEIFPST